MKQYITSLAITSLVSLSFAANSPGDEKIESAITTQFKDFPPTSNLDATIEVSDGVASLTGTAENLPSKKLAAEAASTVSGVKAVVNRLEVREIEREDDIIRYDIDRLFSLNYPDDQKTIKTTVNDGIVTLKGAVSTYELSLLSETMAASVVGVRDVVNLLQVKPLTPSGDDEITQHISLLLKGDPWLETELVMISVENGVVTLNGAVDSYSEKSRLESAVSVYGVTAIDSENLVVSPELRPKMQRPHQPLFKTDEEIKSALENALHQDPRVLAQNVEVSVLDKDVTLIGSVASIGAKAAAETDARNITGARLVYSFLTVETDAELEDDELELALGAVLSADALLSGAEIETEVDSGTVSLNGKVLSKYQRRRALTIAANSIGVEKVISKLRVDWEMPEGYRKENL